MFKIQSKSSIRNSLYPDATTSRFPSAEAEKLEVKPPSLYNYITGLDDARRQLAHFALEKLETALRDTALGYTRTDALRKIAYAYRHFAQCRPELYKAFIVCPSFDDAGIGEAKQAVARTFYQVLEPYQLDHEMKIHFTRCFRSALHGFVSLESTGFFKNGVDAEKSFETLIETSLAPLVQRRGRGKK
ncbi:MAG: WHG domain-containing protein [Treponema sp.]|jgi:AcrR family transcriptional regulator|nr:WHG domain-containing protein [Treponema sp.]